LGTREAKLENGRRDTKSCVAVDVRCSARSLLQVLVRRAGFHLRGATRAGSQRNSFGTCEIFHPVTTAKSQPTSRLRKLAALTAAGTIQAILIASVLNGSAARLVKSLPEALQIVDVTMAEPKPQPIVAEGKPEMVEPALPQISPPDIRIVRERPHAMATVTVPVPQPTIVTIATPEASPAPIVEPTAPTDAIGIAATHTTPPYPASALRMGEQGSVRLHIAINEDGDVSSVEVTQSSGSRRLDEAARAWVQQHWKYQPATIDGKATTATSDAMVVFDLAHPR
jgi:protein TonB